MKIRGVSTLGSFLLKSDYEMYQENCSNICQSLNLQSWVRLQHVEMCWHLYTSTIKDFLNILFIILAWHATQQTLQESAPP